MDPASNKALSSLYPLDKANNAGGQRRRLPQGVPPPAAEAAASGIAPHLRQLMTQYALTGLPPAYVPMKDTTNGSTNDPDSEENKR